LISNFSPGRDSSFWTVLRVSFAVAGDLDLEVARDRHQRDGVLVGVQAREDDGVRARLAGQRVVAQALVGAEDHDRLRLARLRRIDRVQRDDLAPAGDVVEGLLHLVELHERSCGDRARGHQHDRHRRQCRALDQRPAGARRVLGVHPSTARRVGSAGAPSAGTACMKSTSARR
jgi:hypothetical protein